jgi:hypothetical protein
VATLYLKSPALWLSLVQLAWATYSTCTAMFVPLFLEHTEQSMRREFYSPGPLLHEAKVNVVDSVTLSMLVFWVVTKYGLGVLQATR